MVCVSEFQAGDMRIGDTERESAMTALGEHMSAGRLTIDEYGARSAQITTAKTRAELQALFVDLPQPHPAFTGTAVPAPAPVPARSGRPVAHRVFDALVPLAGVVGLAFLVWTHFWFLIFLPAVVVILGQAVLGDDWRKQHRSRKYQYRAERMQQRMEARGQRMQERAQRMADRMNRRFGP
jgi:uncharacterized membrane protein